MEKIIRFCRVSHKRFHLQSLIDIQDQKDNRNLAINKVGIKRAKHPVKVKCQGETIPVIAKFDMSVKLQAEKKGIHMSRFLEVLNNHDWELSVLAMSELNQLIKEKLKSEESFVRAKFEVCLPKIAPVSKKKSYLDYQIEFEATPQYLKSTVWVPVTTLCPCSKAISKYSAHNQRSIIKISAFVEEEVSYEELIKIAEKSASSELFALIKRVDEKYVTERAYENPKFVEDIVRDIAVELQKNKKILNYEIESENLESIHNHSAYAVITE